VKLIHLVGAVAVVVIAVLFDNVHHLC
jgi:hypothetical protein